MYSLEECLLAVKTYYDLGRSAQAIVRRLGYPDGSNLYRWVREYERDHGLHEERIRYGRGTVGVFPPKRKLRPLIYNGLRCAGNRT